jgi:hypothetical protein
VRLLIVTDGSCPAEELRPVLAVLARPTRVTLVAVAEPPTGGLGPPEDMLAPGPAPTPTPTGSPPSPSRTDSAPASSCESCSRSTPLSTATPIGRSY